MADRTIVALGCSPDKDYSFLLPLTCLFWRRIGFEPLVVLTGRGADETGVKKPGTHEWKTDPLASWSLDALQQLGVNTYSAVAVDGYPYATTAQNVRQHVASLIDNEHGDLWIMPADVDLWPIRREFYQRHENSGYKAVLYYWNGDHFLDKKNFLEYVELGKRFQTIPTCHVTMRARDWREMYGYGVGGNLTDNVERTLKNWFAKFPNDGFNVWMSDQDIVTHKLCCQDWFPNGRPPEDDEAHENGGVLFIGRRGHPPINRLCRSVPELWGPPFDPSQWVDAHIPKNPHEHWDAIYPIVEKLLPDHAEWAKVYHGQYAEAAR